MAKDFKNYLDTEIEVMLRDVKKICPVESPDFNGEAMDWVAKHAAQFRAAWDQCRINGCKCREKN